MDASRVLSCVHQRPSLMGRTLSLPEFLTRCVMDFPGAINACGHSVHSRYHGRVAVLCHRCPRGWLLPLRRTRKVVRCWLAGRICNRDRAGPRGGPGTGKSALRVVSGQAHRIVSHHPRRRCGAWESPRLWMHGCVSLQCAHAAGPRHAARRSPAVGSRGRHC